MITERKKISLVFGNPTNLINMKNQNIIFYKMINIFEKKLNMLRNITV